MIRHCFAALLALGLGFGAATPATAGTSRPDPALVQPVQFYGYYGGPGFYRPGFYGPGYYGGPGFYRPGYYGRPFYGPGFYRPGFYGRGFYGPGYYGRGFQGRRFYR